MADGLSDDLMLERAWESALAHLRSRGADVEELLRTAASNLDRRGRHPLPDELGEDEA